MTLSLPPSSFLLSSPLPLPPPSLPPSPSLSHRNTNTVFWCGHIALAAGRIEGKDRRRSSTTASVWSSLKHPLPPIPHSPSLTLTRMAENKLDLETQKETIRLEIRKELKIKEGAEKLLRASVGSRSKNYVTLILKKCNEKLEDMHSELNSLLAQVPDDEMGGY